MFSELMGTLRKLKDEQEILLENTMDLKGSIEEFTKTNEAEIHVVQP